MWLTRAACLIFLYFSLLYHLYCVSVFYVYFAAISAKRSQEMKISEHYDSMQCHNNL